MQPYRLVILLVAGLSAACATARPPTALPSAPKQSSISLTLRAMPAARVNVGPINFTAALHGRIDGAYLCANENWDWGDLTSSSHEYARDLPCQDAAPQEMFVRSHTYNQLGKYTPRLTLYSRSGRVLAAVDATVQIGGDLN